LLSSGALNRAGPGRLYVEIARRRARAGDHVIRVDLSGIGDSPARDSAVDNVIYGPTAIEEAAATAKSLRNELGRTVTLVGLCSGAYHAIRAALISDDVAHVIAINPLVYLVEPGTAIPDDEVEAAETVDRYRANVWQWASWKKVATGRVNIRAAVSAVLRNRWAAVEARVRDISRTVGLPWRHDFGWELQRLAAKGVRVDFVFAESDPGYSLLKIEAGSALATLVSEGKIGVYIVPSANHTFTRRAARNELLELLDSLLSA